MQRLFIAAVLAAASFTATVGTAHADAACPSNDYTVVRTSQIKPTGTIAGFTDAMAAHAKWYTDHGYTADKFSWGQVLAMDAATKSMKPVPGKIVTFHSAASDIPPEKHDAGWAAYVAKYAANSEIVSTQVVCTSH